MARASQSPSHGDGKMKNMPLPLWLLRNRKRQLLKSAFAWCISEGVGIETAAWLKC